MLSQQRDIKYPFHHCNIPSFQLRSEVEPSPYLSASQPLCGSVPFKELFGVNISVRHGDSIERRSCNEKD